MVCTVCKYSSSRHAGVTIKPHTRGCLQQPSPPSSCLPCCFSPLLRTHAPLATRSPQQAPPLEPCLPRTKSLTLPFTLHPYTRGLQPSLPVVSACQPYSSTPWLLLTNTLCSCTTLLAHEQASNPLYTASQHIHEHSPPAPEACCHQLVPCS